MKTLFSVILLVIGSTITRAVEPPLIKLSLPSAKIPVTVEAAIGAEHFFLDRSFDLKTWSPILILPTRQPVNIVDGSTVDHSFTNVFYRTRWPAASVESFKTKWEGFGLLNYRFRLNQRCACTPHELSATITVRDGRIVAADNVISDGHPVSDPDLTRFVTIDDLFMIIETEQPKASVTQVEFDPNLSFPSRAEIDYDVLAQGDETIYEVSDFSHN